jgi:hypothetical protein
MAPVENRNEPEFSEWDISRGNVPGTVGDAAGRILLRHVGHVNSNS